MDNSGFIIEVEENDHFILTLPDDSITKADNLEEIFEAIRTYYEKSLETDSLFPLFPL